MPQDRLAEGPAAETASVSLAMRLGSASGGSIEPAESVQEVSDADTVGLAVEAPAQVESSGASSGIPATDAEPTEAIAPEIEVPAATTSAPPVRRTLPPQVIGLKHPIEKCLEAHLTQRLNSGEDSCWSMMHAFLGWGPTCQIHVGSPRGPLRNAIEWVGQNQSCGGRRLFYLDSSGIRGREGPGYQGHPAQFLAMLAQCDVDTGFPLQVNNRSFTVADLIEQEKRTCSAGRELTFTLISLVHYLGTDAKWQASNGESWDIPKILAIELAQPINGAACGGTHRMMAISFAVAKRRAEGKSIDGHWWRADKYVNDYHRYTMTLQNRDGSFSSDWFRQRSDWGDMNRRVQTTGHILEWLVYSLPDEALTDPRVVHSVEYLTQTLSQHRYHDWEVGPKGHAIRALRLYHQRVFSPEPAPSVPLAQRVDPTEAGR